MINTQAVFQRLDLGETRVAAVQSIRESINRAPDPTARANQLIHAIIGVETKYADETKARLIAMSVGEEAIKANHVIDNAEEFLKLCEARVEAFVTRAENAWMFSKSDGKQSTDNVVQVIDGIETKVAVKSNGKIKKGGKELLAHELYKKHVLEAEKPLSNQEFITVLMKQLDMSKAGATTYAWSCKKKLGEPEGGIVKAKKGRKAKAV